ncbi:hypothetical protein KP509_07G058200 [Ceratopteris richardii]|uniref:RRM domain-containing protein n=1 Tax=Ceratopteris richardii TaxID=49495 RepID=A0A8T2UI55_CERRI|nr:hypothetical protein KP509_07G058200 [Ceratopteris richardii]
MSREDLNAVFYASTYHPIQAGSIDGTDIVPHDHAVCRAMLATSTGLYDPLGDPKAQGNPHCVIFVGRLSKETTETTLQEVLSRYGKIRSLRLVRHVVTGASQGYAFVEYETEREMQYAYEAAHMIKIDGHQILVDYNRQLLMPGWIPRRLGGGLGGRKESGQLRFGGRDRPFRKPLRPIPVKELETLGIPLPGGYMQRYEIPPLPRRSSHSRRKTMKDEEDHDITSDQKSRRDDRHPRTEDRSQSEERTLKYRHRERDDRKEHRVTSPPLSKEHDRHREKDGHRKEKDRTYDRHHHHRHQHRHRRREGSQDSRSLKRSHYSRDDRTCSEDSSESDTRRKTRKAQKRDDYEKYGSREPSVDDRWKP